MAGLDFMTYTGNPGHPVEVPHLGTSTRSPEPPAQADGCRMAVIARMGPWRLLRGPSGGYYADRGDRHGWFALDALGEAQARVEFAAFVETAASL